MNRYRGNTHSQLDHLPHTHDQAVDMSYLFLCGIQRNPCVLCKKLHKTVVENLVFASMLDLQTDNWP
jgi:hypothetical protein